MCERIIGFLERTDPRSLTTFVVVFSGFSAPGTLQRGLETGNKEQLAATTISLFCSILAFAIARSDYWPRKME